ncbi:hypothetical protein GCM10023147_40830 [Tsukamurella soli]|uniref:TadE-like protein n=1 Tax=Tsukamurella soli TaxID=644556 RepID=A0ABP8K787_9ACTN
MVATTAIVCVPAAMALLNAYVVYVAELRVTDPRLTPSTVTAAVGDPRHWAARARRISWVDAATALDVDAVAFALSARAFPLVAVESATVEPDEDGETVIAVPFITTDAASACGGVADTHTAQTRASTTATTGAHRRMGALSDH